MQGAKKVSFTACYFGQAVASMYYPKTHFNKPGKKFLTSRIDYGSSVI